MLGVGVAIGAATAAVGLMKKGWETFERGAEIDALENRFERLADSIGSSGDVLMTRLKEATNGMMTSAELMESATGIMSLGLGKTEDQTVRLATVVGKLGWDMQQVILTMATIPRCGWIRWACQLKTLTTRGEGAGGAGLLDRRGVRHGRD